MSEGKPSEEGPPIEGPKGRSVITHIAIRTRDIDASIDFYRRYAGFEIVHDRTDDGIRVVWVAERPTNPDFVLVLLALPHEAVIDPGSTDHYGFAVESREEVDRIGELARSEKRLKYGPVYAGPVVGYLVMVRDPSGNTCEFSHGQSIGRDDAPG